MNFARLQERVRVELLRRIERGTLSVSLLARQTGLGQGHVSNFLRSRRQMSQGSLDLILTALRMEVEDLLPSREDTGQAFSGHFDLFGGKGAKFAMIPLVGDAATTFEPNIRPSQVERLLSFPAEMVGAWRPRCTPGRKMWERFVAVRASAEDGRAMEPRIVAGSLVVLDRQYNSFKAYSEFKSSEPAGEKRTPGSEKADAARPNVYGVRKGASLLLRYAEFKLNRLLLRPTGLGFALDVLQVQDGESPNDLLVGRVVVVVNEM